LASGQEVVRWDLPEHTAPISVAFTPGGRYLVTGMTDSTLLVWDLLSPPRAKAPRPEPLWGLWERLAEDAAGAHRALAELAASGDEAVTLLGRHLGPMRRPPEEALARLLADLDSEQFDKRQKASEELAKVIDVIRPDFERLRKGSSEEVRRRVGELLKENDGLTLPPQTRRAVRAVAALEHIGTPAARLLLGRLAEGASEARQTREANAALERLRRRGAD
jgi:hypothetical protein